MVIMELTSDFLEEGEGRKRGWMREGRRDGDRDRGVEGEGGRREGGRREGKKGERKVERRERRKRSDEQVSGQVKHRVLRS